MKRMRKKATTLLMSALIALTAVMPASASTSTSISVSNAYYYNNAVLYGVKAKFQVINNSYSSNAPIYYALYGTNEYISPIEGYVYPGETFTSEEFYHEEYGRFEEGMFELYIECKGTSYCLGNATLEIVE